MFASVNARAGWGRLKAPALPESDDNDNESAEEIESIISRKSKSLAIRRVQNLTAILNVSLLRRDNKRALRAFSLLLRCEKHGVTLRMLWELGLEVLMRSTETSSKVKAEEFLGRVRLTSSDIGRHSTTENKVITTRL
jgi:hypothetical protein